MQWNGLQFPYVKDTLTPIGKNFRRGKRIERISNERYLNDLLFFDTEAQITPKTLNEELHTTKLIVYRHMRIDDDMTILLNEYGNVFNNDDFINILVNKARKDKTLYVICHNASYDVQITGVLNGLMNKGYKVGYSVLEFPPFVVTLSKGKHRIVLLDNLNYARTSIKELGKSIGLDKYEIDYNVDGVNDELLVYAYRDVEILSEWFINYYRFLRDNDLLPFAYTLAGQAFRTYRYRFLPREIPLHRVDEVLKVERETYIGGRVECFRIGTFAGEIFYKLDINSMYPFVMRNKKYPYVYLGKRENVGIQDLHRLIENYYIIADIDIDINIPVIPYRYNGMVIYPLGRFRTILHKGELDLALRYAKYINVNNLYVYREDDLFSSYIDYFYHLKVDAELRGDKVYRQMAKLMMNSLYGKFGQAGYQDVLIDEGIPDGEFYRYQGYSQRLGKEVVITHINGKEYTTLKTGESYYSYPAIAGAVTSYARAYLAELLLIAGIENVYYSDTDSLIVNKKGYNNLEDYINTTLLGYLKVEAVSDYLELRGLKDYRIGDDEKIKGVNKNAIKISNNVFINTQFRGAKTWLRDGGKAEVIVRRVEKRLNRVYRKGVIQGSYVLPFSFEELPTSLAKSP